MSSSALSFPCFDRSLLETVRGALPDEWRDVVLVSCRTRGVGFYVDGRTLAAVQFHPSKGYGRDYVLHLPYLRADTGQWEIDQSDLDDWIGQRYASFADALRAFVVWTVDRHLINALAGHEAHQRALHAAALHDADCIAINTSEEYL